MVKHKLDEEVEDILQHYGIKGMKWGTSRGNSKLPAAGDSGGGGGDDGEDEELDDGEAMFKLFEEHALKNENMLDKFERKMGNIGDAIKKKGFNLLKSIFGESKKTYKVTTLDAAMKKKGFTKGKNPFVNADGTIKAEFKDYNKKSRNDKHGKAAKPKKPKKQEFIMSDKDTALLKKLKGRGFKGGLVLKNTKKAKAERAKEAKKYKVTFVETKINGKSVTNKTEASVLKEWKKEVAKTKARDKKYGR